MCRSFAFQTAWTSTFTQKPTVQLCIDLGARSNSADTLRIPKEFYRRMEFADGRRQEADGRRQEAGGRRQESRRQEAGTAATGKGAMRHSQCVSPSDPRQQLRGIW